MLKLQQLIQVSKLQLRELHTKIKQNAFILICINLYNNLLILHSQVNMYFHVMLRYNL